jgi:hypothetical protein
VAQELEAKGYDELRRELGLEPGAAGTEPRDPFADL